MSGSQDPFQDATYPRLAWQSVPEARSQNTSVGAGSETLQDAPPQDADIPGTSWLLKVLLIVRM